MYVVTLDIRWLHIKGVQTLKNGVMWPKVSQCMLLCLAKVTSAVLYVWFITLMLCCKLNSFHMNYVLLCYIDYLYIQHYTLTHTQSQTCCLVPSVDTAAVPTNVAVTGRIPSPHAAFCDGNSAHSNHMHTSAKLNIACDVRPVSKLMS